MRNFVLRSGLFIIGFLSGILALMIYRPSESELARERMRGREDQVRDGQEFERLMQDRRAKLKGQ